jgi:hypothetical protein
MPDSKIDKELKNAKIRLAVAEEAGAPQWKIDRLREKLLAAQTKKDMNRSSHG